MDIMVYTSDPDSIDPQHIAELLEADHFFVLSVNVNEGDRLWTLPGSTYVQGGNLIR